MRALLGVAAALCVAAAAAAQSFPAKPVRIVVGFAAGGPTDVIARVIAQDMTASLGQSVIVENRTGANAIIATETNRARIDSAQTARELAEQRLDAEKTKFDLGVSTLRFVLEEQRNVSQAQTNELQAVVNFTMSMVDLDRAMGTTLKRNNVELDKALGAPETAR